MEIWKEVYGYDGVYFISDKGRIKSVDRRIPNTNGVGTRLIKGKILSTTLNNKGYKCVSLHKNGKIKTFTIHRLVALSFIPNPNNYSDVNHKDENKLNNNAENLEWVTHEYNMNYGERGKKAGEKLKNTRLLSKNGKAHKVINLDTKKIFGCIREASMHYNVNESGISQCCRGKSKKCGGYRWMYYEDYSNKTILGEVTV